MFLRPPTYESIHDPVLSPHLYTRRTLRSLGLVVALIVPSLTMGVLGYRMFEGMPWIDSLYNAAMILSGMGPSGDLHNNAAKLFASFYAIYSGLFLIASSGLLLAPLYHRILHTFHVPDDEGSNDPDDGGAARKRQR